MMDFCCAVEWGVEYVKCYGMMDLSMANKPVKHILSYHTRLPASPAVDTALSAYAVLYGRAERKLFAAIVANDTDPNTLKRELTRSAGLTARQFNAIRAGLDGKISSIKERRPDLIREGEQKLVLQKRSSPRFGCNSPRFATRSPRSRPARLLRFCLTLSGRLPCKSLALSSTRNNVAW